MSAASGAEIARLRGPVLKSVSRSFYLSIRLLPEKLRDPIALAYLLARATDTIADTAEVEADLRSEQLANLAALIQHESGSATADPLQRFATLQRDDAERVLIEAVPTLLRWLASLAPADQRDIRKVLKAINEGQTLDVRRFGGREQITALPTAADLDRYTYLVAGSVGEFWTRTCFRHVRVFSEESEQVMIERGIAYGKGLQLINILRDIGADLRAGRCYLPAEELHSLGTSPEAIAANPAAAESVVRKWRERAEQGIAAGIDYSCAIRSTRVRLATALPALIGARTLALLEQAGPAAFTQKIKVPRSDVRQIVWRTTVGLASPRAVCRIFTDLSS